MDTYAILCRDLYSIGIFDEKINGLLSIVEKDDDARTMLVERKYIDCNGNPGVSGYYFIQCLQVCCEEKHLKNYRQRLEDIVKQKAKGNFMEVSPIIVAPEFNDAVNDFVAQYNRIQRRKPIKLETHKG